MTKQRSVQTQFGSVHLDPLDDVIAGSVGTWRVTYLAGELGITPGGGIVLARAWPADWGQPQWTDPAGRDYTIFSTTGPGRLVPHFERKLNDPTWNPHAIHALFVDVEDQALRPGDRITVTLGDTSAGSSGFLAQTFLEEQSTLHVAVDVDGAGQWQPLSPLLSPRVVGGPATRLVVIAPSAVTSHEEFVVAVRAEDRWGNPSPEYRGRVRLEAEGEAEVEYQFAAGDGGVGRLTYRLAQPGIHRLGAVDEAGSLAAASNPIKCRASDPEFRLFWGELHGQSQVGCGARTVENYLRHARDVAAVDFAADQANDHYITNEMWLETQRAIQDIHDPGRFVAFLGYEWSGETEDGGDHNVYFPGDEGPILRSSHSLIEDKSDVDTDLRHITEVYEAFGGQDVLIVPHVGGRPANLAYHDPDLEPVIEIHSSHATSEWFFEEALQRGYKVGVAAGSDDVMGRPGASYPGNHIGRNLRGGLTAVYARELTREAIWEAIRARRCYATTGPRLLLSVTSDGHWMGEEYAADAPPTIAVEVTGAVELETVELFRGRQLIYSPALLDHNRTQPDVIRIVWSGAKGRGSAIKARLVWDGELTLDAGRILEVTEYAFDTPATGIREVEERRVTWRSFTAGDPDGLLVRFEAPDDALFNFSTPPASFSFTPAEIAAGSKLVEAGPVGRKVIVRGVPVEPGPRSVHFTYSDHQIVPGINPYYVRVTQADGERAWSSPIYVSYG